MKALPKFHHFSVINANNYPNRCTIPRVKFTLFWFDMNFDFSYDITKSTVDKDKAVLQINEKNCNKITKTAYKKDRDSIISLKRMQTRSKCNIQPYGRIIQEKLVCKILTT